MKIEYTDQLCVFFLTTTFEYESGELVTALTHYLSECKSSQCTNKFDLLVFFDKLPKSSLVKLKKFNKHQNINKISIFTNDIIDDENIYERDLNKEFPLEKLPLGRSHGINYHFYKTLEYLFKTKYKCFLLLESDTKPLKSDWFQNIKKYIDCNEDFKIAGSLYKGVNHQIHRESYYGGHLNGVGLYSNSKKTKELLKNSKKYLIQQLKNDYLKPKSKQRYWEFMNYDVAIYLYAKEHNELCGYEDTELFTNASAPEDSNITISEILNQYPDTCILHRKKLYDK